VRWGGIFSLTSDQNAKMRFDNNRSGYRLSTSVGGSVTGEGGDRIVCDDPHKVDEVDSDTSRKKVLDWWDVAMSTRVNDPKTSAMVVVMQRCHQRDLSGHLLEKGNFEHLSLPAEYEGPGRTTSIGFSDLRTEPGQLLWPERYGPEEIVEAKLNLGSYAAAGQLQQRPSPAGGGIFKRHWFRFWQLPGINLPPVIVRLPDGTRMSIEPIELRSVDDDLQSWDCAFKGEETSDYVVGQVWARAGSAYILGDQVRGRMDFPATLNAFRQLSRKYPGILAKLVEDKANGSAVVQTLVREIPGIIPVNPEGGKLARARAISPFVEAGNVYLPHPEYAPWVLDFIEECVQFPNGANDDQVDAMTQAILRLSQPQVQTYVWEFPHVQISPI
jgi:predicted phage terminase large subunit-like protein